MTENVFAIARHYAQLVAVEFHGDIVHQLQTGELGMGGLYAGIDDRDLHAPAGAFGDGVLTTL